jgi:hypothetical protein
MFARLHEWVSRVVALFRTRRLDAELDQELNLHLGMLEEENTRRGMPPQEARRVAHLTLGNAAQLREAHRDKRGLPLIESLVQDVRYASRSLAKIPDFTASEPIPPFSTSSTRLYSGPWISPSHKSWPTSSPSTRHRRRFYPVPIPTTKT